MTTSRSKSPATVTTIAAEWERFAAMCLPPDAGSGQVRDMRAAFYAGVYAALLMNVEVIALPEPAAMRVLDAWHAEAQAFAQTLRPSC